MKLPLWRRLAGEDCYVGRIGVVGSNSLLCDLLGKDLFTKCNKEKGSRKCPPSDNGILLKRVKLKFYQCCLPIQPPLL